MAPSVDLAFLPEADLPQATPAVVPADHQRAIQGADLAVPADHPQAIVAVEVAAPRLVTAAAVEPLGHLLDTAVVEPVGLPLATVVEPVGHRQDTAAVGRVDLLLATVAVHLLQAIIQGPNFYPQVKSVLPVDRAPERWDCAEVRQDRQALEPDRLDPEVALVWI